MINDAEDDLKDWRLELDDLTSLDNTAIPDPTNQQQKGGEGSVVEDAATPKHPAVQRTESNVEGSRISSGTSVATGPVGQSYVGNEAPNAVPG